MKRKTMTFTKPQRKLLVTGMKVRLSQILGVDAKFEPSELDPGELRYALPMPWISINGPLRWAIFEIRPVGIDTLIAFDFVEWWPRPGLRNVNPYSGKWNHHLWPDGPGDDPAMLSGLFQVVENILREIRPAPLEMIGVPRTRATLLAALCYYRNDLEAEGAAWTHSEMATEGGRFEPLTVEEIDTLVEKLEGRGA